MPSSKTLIGGTVYDIKGGKTLIGGTGYDIKKGRTLIGGTEYDIKFTVPLGELAEGTIITIKENGSPIEFFTAKQDYESDLNGTGRVLFVRKDCWEELQAVSSGNSTVSFEYTTVCRNLNNTYLALFSSTVQSAISTTTFYCGRNSQTDAKPIFLLSATEMGYDASNASIPVTWTEGTMLAISNLLIPSEQTQWTRSQARNYTSRYVAVTTSGTFFAAVQTLERAVCPCFTLPATMEVDSNLELIEE